MNEEDTYQLAKLKQEVYHLRAELSYQKTFERAFADKLKEFGTIDRLVEEYGNMKQENRTIKSQLAYVLKEWVHPDQLEEVKQILEKGAF